MNEPNDCLHCGGKAKADYTHHSGHGYDDGYRSYSVTCTRCGITTGGRGTEEAAIRIWNQSVLPVISDATVLLG